jgi:hypothetical protein
MLVSSPNGAYFIPAQGYIRPANVPTNVMGLVLVNFYDSEGRETRTRVPITLLGNGTPNGQQPVPQSVLSQTQASQPVTQTPLFPLPGAAGTVRTAGPQTSALPPPPSPRPAGLPPPPPLPPEAVALPSVADPDLSRELMMAQTTQLRSLTLQAEEAAGSAIDLEKMSVLRDANYTREVGEAFQLNSAMRREVFATQTAYHEKAFRQLDLVDVAARRMLRLSDEVVRRVKDPMFQPAPPPPPPPPPPPDYAGIAIAMFQALGRVGAAWSPNAKRKPGRRERQAVLKLLEKAQASGPEGLKVALDEFAKKGGAGATPESVKEPKPQPDNDNKTFAISKKQLLDLVESGAISTLTENGKLAEMIRDDKLDEFMKLLSQAEEL